MREPWFPPVTLQSVVSPRTGVAVPISFEEALSSGQHDGGCPHHALDEQLAPLDGLVFPPGSLHQKPRIGQRRRAASPECRCAVRNRAEAPRHGSLRMGGDCPVVLFSIGHIVIQVIERHEHGREYRRERGPDLQPCLPGPCLHGQEGQAFGRTNHLFDDFVVDEFCS